MAVLRVVTPGLLTTVQDEGRWGYQSGGVPVAGPMDPLSHRLANALVGNPRSAASLEVTIAGPELIFEDERIVAIAGADFAVTLDDRAVPVHVPLVLSAGTSLRFGLRQRGTRAYIGIEGGIAVPPVLGSRATHLLARMGGLDGRALRAGDRVPLGDRRARSSRRTRALPGPLYNREWSRQVSLQNSNRRPEQLARVRVLPGPNLEAFAADALDVLQSAPYRVGRASDRMGFRLDGPVLTHAHGGDIISEATPLGSLQVPASGQPILLMADRQTSGGYPKIATVISADIGVAGQLAPGDAVTFVACSARDAMAALIIQERTVMALEAGASS